VKWRRLLNDVVTTCFQVADVVLPVVSNSSPEGNIPDDVTIPASECHGELCDVNIEMCIIFFGPGNGSLSATNVVLLRLLLVSAKAFSFHSRSSSNFAYRLVTISSRIAPCRIFKLSPN